MAYYFSPIGNGVAFVDSSGNPLSGAQLFTYTAGSSTKATVYQTNAGTAHANPIILDANGRPPAAIWLTGGVSYKFVLAPSNDTDPPAAAIYTWDNVSGINDTSVSIDEWVSGTTPTFVDANTFTLVGDQSSTFHVNRRIKATVTAGTVYGYISAVAYTTLTTVDVVLDSGALDSGLSAVSYALLSGTNQSYPGNLATTDTAQTISGAKTMTGLLTMSGKPIEFAEGAAVASAATTDIWTPADGNTVHVTGTTTITSFGTAPQAGAYRRVIFDGSLTLTHGANLGIPGAANIVTSAGDTCVVYADTTTQFDVVEYTRGDGRSVISGGVETFTSSGTFTAKRTGTHLILAQGGGGSGGNGTNRAVNAGGGGGGGGGAGRGQWFTQSLTAGTGYTVTIGAGGGFGAVAAGGTTTFNGTGPGGGAAGSSASGSTGGAGGASAAVVSGGTAGGGTATAGANSSPGTSSDGSTGGNGDNTNGHGGGGGAGGHSMFTVGGGGGNGGAAAANGQNGSNGSLGSGGGGGGGSGVDGSGAGNGGAGGDGFCVVFW